jgi:hypothetical protein
MVVCARRQCLLPRPGRRPGRAAGSLALFLAIVFSAAAASAGDMGRPDPVTATLSLSIRVARATSSSNVSHYEICKKYGKSIYCNMKLNGNVLATMERVAAPDSPALDLIRPE